MNNNRSGFLHKYERGYDTFIAFSIVIENI